MIKNLDRYFDRIEKLKSRSSPGRYNSLSDRQKYLHSVLKHMGEEDQIIQRHNIQAHCEPSFAAADRRNVVTDFCYNKVNLEDNENKFLLSVGKGLFRFVGFDWQPEQSESVTWEVEVLKTKFMVAEYRDGEFRWNFDQLIQALRKHCARN